MVQAEGPILTARLAKLTAYRFGLDRLRGARERQILDRLPAELIRRSANGDEVAWPLSIDARAYRDFRVPGDERTVTEVPYEELRNAMCDAVRRSFALGYEDCLRETARIFGWSRLGSQVRDRLDGVLRAAVNERALVVDGERLRASFLGPKFVGTLRQGYAGNSCGRTSRSNAAARRTDTDCVCGGGSVT